jgi:hypothetical protein
MFQINSILLIKMGWVDNRTWRLNSPLFDDNELVKFYIRKETIYILIKELSEEEKQISKNLYKFVVGKNSIEFNSNIELLKLIIEHEACNEEYQRHFRINKILKNK